MCDFIFNSFNKWWFTRIHILNTSTHQKPTKQKEKTYFSIVIPFFDDVQRQGEEVSVSTSASALYPLPSASASALYLLPSASTSTLCPLLPSPPPPPPLVCESKILPSTKPINILMFWISSDCLFCFLNLFILFWYFVLSSHFIFFLFSFPSQII